MSQAPETGPGGLMLVAGGEVGSRVAASRSELKAPALAEQECEAPWGPPVSCGGSGRRPGTSVQGRGGGGGDAHLAWVRRWICLPPAGRPHSPPQALHPSAVIPSSSGSSGGPLRSPPLPLRLGPLGEAASSLPSSPLPRPSGSLPPPRLAGRLCCRRPVWAGAPSAPSLPPPAALRLRFLLMTWPRWSGMR